MTRVRVTVFGSSYYISTEDSEAHIREIERRLEQAVGEITDARPELSSLDVFALLSLNLMDELMHTQESTDRMREQLSQYLEEAARSRIELDEIRRASDGGKPDVASLRAEISRLRQERDDAVKDAALLREERFALATQLGFGDEGIVTQEDDER